MTLTLLEMKTLLRHKDRIAFQLPDGSLVPEHFHLTEVGKVKKKFIDCGGKVRDEQIASLQLWQAGDYNHRLEPQKMLQIIELSQRKLDMGDDFLIEVEYQSETIGKYSLEYNGEHLLLTSKHTDCLAKVGCTSSNPNPQGESKPAGASARCC